MPLTHAEIRNAKPGLKPIKLFDGGGLYLELSPRGGKWWRFKFRFGGKEKRLSLGTWPEVGLKEARERREEAEARSQLTLGVNPGVLRKSHWAAQMAIDTISFEVVARE